MAARLDWDRWAWLAGMVLAAAIVGILAGFDPRLALAAAFAAGFVVVAFADLAAGLALFTLVAFFEVFSLPGAVVSIAKPAGLLLALSWFAVISTRRRAELEFFSVHPLIATGLGLFCVWALLSTAWATSTSSALDSVGRYALNVLLFLIVFTAVRTRRDLSWVLSAFLIGAAVTAMSGIVAPTGEEAAGRLGSVALDPSELAAVLVAGVALAIAVIALNKRSPGVQLAAAAAGTFAVIAVWLTASRGGLVALAAALIAAVVLSPRWRVPLAIGGVLVVMATYFYFEAVASPEIRERIEEPSQGQARIEEGRTTIWQVAWRAFEDNPVTGVGTGNFPVVSREYLLEPGVLARSDEIISTPKVVHNAYLEVATEMGVVGFALFVLVLGFSVGSLVIAAREFGKVGDARMQAASVAIAVAIVGILAALTFTSDQYSKQLWLLMGLGPAVLTMARSEVRAKEDGAG